jgi:iron complex outermembrane receptor protein
MTSRLLTAALVLTIVAPLGAQEQHAASTQTPQQQQEQTPQKPTYEEQVVVSASREAETLVNAPAAVSVITTAAIESSPAMNMGDLLRAVPGMNVTQVSARDVNFTTRGATSTLATSQLALVDGRSVYLDFFGMVMWDLIPTSPHEIKQIEVVRGPASAVWGANAMSGVVNVITRSPRELAAGGGRSLTIGVGTFDRDVTGHSQANGTLFYVNGSQAQAVNDRWSYKIGAGYLTQDPLPRPTGTLPSGTPYPPFENTGTTQPKFSARVDYDVPNGGRIVFDGGVSGTEGMIHTGIGPFDIHNGSRMGYFTTRYEKGGRRVAFFTNLLDGDATNLLTVGPNGRPIDLSFDTKTFDIEASDVHTVGARHAFTYGGNYRHNAFDISLAPLGEDRNEGGAYVQDEMFLGRQFRWVLGGRVDKFSSINDAVFSPRTTFMYKPAQDHTIRASFNRAFRAPSLINNSLDVTVITPVQLPPPVGLFAFPSRALGNPDLKQETLTAYEIGYTGLVQKRATVSASVYWNNTGDGIFFTPSVSYTPLSPPPGLPAFLVAALAARGIVLPSQYTYFNLGKIHDKGIELGVDAALNRSVSVFTNYSYQWKPTIADFPAGTGINDINWPPKNRFNAGVNFTYSRYLGNMSVNYTDSAYWQDVLDARFAGTTGAYTLVNGAFGVRWLSDRLTTSVKVTNLANQEVMQHIFGDVLKRQVVGEVRVEF